MLFRSNDTATTEIYTRLYTLYLHDALPIFVVPCAQLVRDNRQDASVDLALGAYSNDLAPTPAAKQVLTQLAAWAVKHPTTSGGLQAQNSQQPAVSASLLAGAHTFRC